MTVEDWARIRHLHEAEGLSQRQIAEEFCQRTVGCPCGRTGDLPVGGQFISLSAVS
ncbi:hypothetical protein GCM10022262_42760 [Georgenia daeguensis]|uniref:Helix-turn-helix domain-containing protein n=1 Tax=Georgenia daeguensis TaxID=908355 RepID=A0ABP6UPH8_9MICO